MKKLLYTLSLLLLVTVLAAQETKIGVFIDPQVTWLSPEARNVEKAGAFFGIKGGLMLDQYFKKNYAIHLGLALGTQGGSIKYNDPYQIETLDSVETLAAGSTVEYHLQYITVPIGLKLKTNQIGYFSYYAQVGFTNQINVKAKVSTRDGYLEKDIVKNEINIYNLAYHFGLGAEYSISRDTSVGLGVTYHSGFMAITQNSDARIFSRMLEFSVFVIF